MTLVTIEQHGGTAVVRYANPPWGTMTARGSEEMYRAVKGLAGDEAVRCIVLTGGLPDIFVRHYDVAELSGLSDQLHGDAPAPDRATPAERPPEGGYFAALIDLIAAAPKPVIAAINGLCMGGGFEMALACDLRLCAPRVAAIGLPETRIGIFPGGGGTQRLPRVIGEAKALEFILRGRTVTGAEAGDLGLVHEVVADPVKRALEIGAEFETRGADGIAYAKRLTRAALDRPLAEGLADERRSFVAVLRTASARQGLRDGARPGTEIQKA